jgi:hypothetical protein
MKNTKTLAKVSKGKDESIFKQKSDVEAMFKEEISEAENMAKRAIEDQYNHSARSNVPVLHNDED